MRSFSGFRSAPAGAAAAFCRSGDGAGEEREGKSGAFESCGVGRFETAAQQQQPKGRSHDPPAADSRWRLQYPKLSLRARRAELAATSRPMVRPPRLFP